MGMSPAIPLAIPLLQPPLAVRSPVLTVGSRRRIVCLIFACGAGDVDMAVLNIGTANQLYINVDGAGHFDEQAGLRGFSVNNESRGAVAADFDGDGTLDVFMCGEFPVSSLGVPQGLLVTLPPP